MPWVTRTRLWNFDLINLQIQQYLEQSGRLFWNVKKSQQIFINQRNFEIKEMYALVAKNAPKDHDVMTDKLFWHHWRFCEGNPQVTDGFLQSYAELWYFLCSYREQAVEKKWIGRWVETPWRICDVIVMQGNVSKLHWLSVMKGIFNWPFLSVSHQVQWLYQRYACPHGRPQLIEGHLADRCLHLGRRLWPDWLAASDLQRGWYPRRNTGINYKMKSQCLFQHF